MSTLSILLILSVVGVFLWLINRYIPMKSAIRFILNLLVVIAVVLWLLHQLGIITDLGDWRLPRIS